jgi:hypothetical protein
MIFISMKSDITRLKKVWRQQLLVISSIWTKVDDRTTQGYLFLAATSQHLHVDGISPTTVKPAKVGITSEGIRYIIWSRPLESWLARNYLVYWGQSR